MSISTFCGLSPVPSFSLLARFFFFFFPDVLSASFFLILFYHFFDASFWFSSGFV